MSERGIKETKEVLAFVFSLSNAIKVSLSDGDFDFWDAKNFVEPLKKIAPAVENIDEVLPELDDLEWDEIIELAKEPGSSDQYNHPTRILIKFKNEDTD